MTGNSMRDFLQVKGLILGGSPIPLLDISVFLQA